jgi:thioredoxin reductase (NADPH)
VSVRPVLLSVDDDPAVSRAVARDLRRRYGDRYRVVRAESGASALEALREFTLRGEPTALLLADHRMPLMTGVEFLEQAMDVVPDAKRVLLTAYADTDAAIKAINDVDLDHYLLKPWDPPEEKLYPVVDELLGAWTSQARPSFTGITVLGHQWSAETQAAKEFLARNQVPYRHLDVTEPAGARLLAATGVPDDTPLPVVLLPSGEVLHRPSLRELAARAGLSTEAGSPFYDLVVVGGGPAGLGAAVYGASEGLRTLLVERAATGGQAGQSSRIENYLGFPQGLSGAELAQRARDQALRFGVEVVTAAEVTASPSTARAGRALRRRRPTSRRTPSCCDRASPTPGSPPAGWTTSPGAASTTAPRRTRRSTAGTRTSTSSARPTPPARPRCSSPATPARRHRRARQRPAPQHVGVPRARIEQEPTHRGAHLHRDRRGRRRRATSSS